MDEASRGARMVTQMQNLNPFAPGKWFTGIQGGTRMTPWAAGSATDTFGSAGISVRKHSRHSTA